MLGKEDILEAVNDFTDQAYKYLEGSRDWFEEQGIDTDDLVIFFSQMISTGPDAMRKIMEEGDFDYEDERYQRSEAMIDLMESAMEDPRKHEILVTLLMISAAVGVNLVKKRSENEIEWNI